MSTHFFNKRSVLFFSAESRFRSIIKTGEGQNGMILAARALVNAGVLEGGNAELQTVAARVRKIAASGTKGAAVPTDAEMRETFVELAVADVIGRLKNGAKVGAGVITETIDAALRQSAAADRGAWGWTKTFLRAVRNYLRGVFGVASRINRARREGKLKEGDDFTAFVDKLLGTDVQKQHNAAVLATVDAGRIMGNTFSLSANRPDASGLQAAALSSSLNSYEYSPTEFTGRAQEAFEAAAKSFGGRIEARACPQSLYSAIQGLENVTGLSIRFFSGAADNGTGGFLIPEFPADTTRGLSSSVLVCRRSGGRSNCRLCGGL